MPPISRSNSFLLQSPSSLSFADLAIDSQKKPPGRGQRNAKKNDSENDSQLPPTASSSSRGKVSSIKHNHSHSNKGKSHAAHNSNKKTRSVPSTPKSGDKRSLVSVTDSNKENVDDASTAEHATTDNNANAGAGGRRKSAKKSLLTDLHDVNATESLTRSNSVTTQITQQVANVKVSSPSPSHSLLHTSLHILLQSVELLYWNDAAQLKELHRLLKLLVPLTPEKYDVIYTLLTTKFSTPRIIERVEQQLLALNTSANNGIIISKHLPTYEKYGGIKTTCRNKKCTLYVTNPSTATVNTNVNNSKFQQSILYTMCSQCGTVGSVEPIDLMYFMKKNTNTAATATASASNKLKKASTTATTAATDHETKANHSNKVERTTYDYTNPHVLYQQREASTVRAIATIRKLAVKGQLQSFEVYAGDVIFLLRNAIYRGRTAVVRETAKEAVEGMLKRWDKGDTSILESYCDVEQLMGFAECLHAKKEMKWLSDEREFNRLKDKVAVALSHISVHDLLRFNPTTAKSIPLTDAGYCRACGVFEKLQYGVCQQEGCTEKLTQEREFEAMTESLVWTSVFRDLGIEPLATHDAHVMLPDVLKLMSQIRPYGSLETLGKDSYITQCYWITHLIFIMSGWGAVQLERELFVEEYLFLTSNMDVCIKLKDPELIGEFCHSLHILGSSYTVDNPQSMSIDSLALLKGHYNLLCTEKGSKDKLLGNWVPSSATYHKRYHTAYTGVIGLADMQFDKAGSEAAYMRDEWRHFFM